MSDLIQEIETAYADYISTRDSLYSRAATHGAEGNPTLDAPGKGVTFWTGSPIKWLGGGRH